MNPLLFASSKGLAAIASGALPFDLLLEPAKPTSMPLPPTHWGLRKPFLLKQLIDAIVALIGPGEKPPAS